MKKFIISCLLFMIFLNCETDVNQPVHDSNVAEIFSCNWIVILDHWSEPFEYKCWSISPIYLEEFDITPQIATRIIVTFDEDTKEALVENPQGLEIIYDISDTSKVVYEKTFQKSKIK